MARISTHTHSGTIEGKAGNGALAVVPAGSVTMMLSQLGGFPLLTADDEIRLAQDYREGVAATARLEAAANEGSRPDPHDKQLAVCGAEALGQMATHNVKLVIAQAKRHQNRGVEFEDLVAEGLCALVKACKAYDPSLGRRFSSYAVPTINGAMSQLTHKLGPVLKVSPESVSKVSRMRKTEAELTERNAGIMPTEDELAKAMGVSCCDLMELRSLESGLRPAEFDETMVPPAKFSMAGSLAGSLVGSPAGEAMDVDEEVGQASRLVEACLSHLNPQQRRVLALRFGLGDFGPMTQQEVADMLGVSKARIHQIEKEAMARLRSIGYDTLLLEAA